MSTPYVDLGEPLASGRPSRVKQAALAGLSLLGFGCALLLLSMAHRPGMVDSATDLYSVRVRGGAQPSTGLRHQVPSHSWSPLRTNTITPRQGQTHGFAIGAPAQHTWNSKTPILHKSRGIQTISHVSKEAVQASAAAPVTEKEVVAVQTAWANAIKRISKVYKDGGDYVQAAADAAAELYAYGRDDVLFKPTKAAEYQFRPTAADAMSYFVGAKAVKDGYDEDGGFAINGGKGWSDCVYDNHQIKLIGDVAIAMGNYYFTDATDGGKSKVEYTFGYKRCADGKVRIFLHHSSVPFSAAPAAPVAEKSSTNGNLMVAAAMIALSSCIPLLYIAFQLTLFGAKFL